MCDAVGNDLYVRSTFLMFLLDIPLRNLRSWGPCSSVKFFTVERLLFCLIGTFGS